MTEKAILHDVEAGAELVRESRYRDIRAELVRVTRTTRTQVHIGANRYYRDGRAMGRGSMVIRKLKAGERDQILADNARRSQEGDLRELFRTYNGPECLSNAEIAALHAIIKPHLKE